MQGCRKVSVRYGLLLAGILSLTSPTHAQAPPRLDAEWVSRWSEDLESTKQSFPKNHRDLYNKLSKAEFESRVDDLITRLPQLSHVQATVGLARIVAMIGDGHTRVTLPLAEGVDFRQGHTNTPAALAPGLVFRQLPIRLRNFPDGLHVTAIDAEHGEWVGSRVTRVGSTGIDDAAAAVAEIVHRDNEIGVQRWLPRYMCLAEVLYAVGLIESPERAEWTLVNAAGQETTIALGAVDPGATVRWVYARDESPEASPLWLRDPEDFFWYEYLEDQRAVYFQYNRVSDKDDVVLADFVQDMLDFIDTHEVDRLVIDLRHNDGGDNTLNRAIIHGLIRSRKLRERGSLYAIIGRETFSAALMFTTSLEKHTPVLLVGEQTGASPNDYGDSRKVQLANTGLTVRLSTLYHQTSGPTDMREAVAPHFAVDIGFEDFVANRDPVLDFILGLRESDSPPHGTWRGTFSPSPWTPYPVQVTFSQQDGMVTATLGVDGTAIQNVPMEDVTADASSLSFVWMFNGSPLRIRGRLFQDAAGRGRFLADVDMSGRLSVMLLEAPER